MCGDGIECGNVATGNCFVLTKISIESGFAKIAKFIPISVQTNLSTVNFS